MSEISVFLVYVLLIIIYIYRAAEATFQEGGLIKIKREVSNLLILVSSGGTTTVCTGEKFLNSRVTRLAKICFLTHFFFVICCQIKRSFLNICKVVAMRCIIDASIKTLLGAIIKYVCVSVVKKCYFFGKFCISALWMAPYGV